MKTKMTVHNLMEVKALIKESFAQGAEHEFNETKWFSHAGQYICKSFVRDVEFELVVEDIQSLDGFRSVTVEV
jgi:propanediol utilization protein